MYIVLPLGPSTSVMPDVIIEHISVHVNKKKSEILVLIITVYEDGLGKLVVKPVKRMSIDRESTVINFTSEHLCCRDVHLLLLKLRLLGFSSGY
jgi:hypothetical protein